MHNLTEYSENYSDTSGRLWQFKRDEVLANVDLLLRILSHSNIKQLLK